MPKPRGHAHRSRNLSLDELSKYFHLPINEVAAKLGLCVTVLKQRCRDHGIGRWPYRKVRKLDNLINALESGSKQRPTSSTLDVSKEESKRKLDAAIETRRAILMDPNSKAHLSIGKVKGGNVGRRRHGVAALFTSRISLSLGAHMRGGAHLLGDTSDEAGRSVPATDLDAGSEDGRELLESRTLPNVTSPPIQSSEDMRCPPCPPCIWRDDEEFNLETEEVGEENMESKALNEVYRCQAMNVETSGVGLGGLANTGNWASAFRKLEKPITRCTSTASTVSVAMQAADEQVQVDEVKERNMRPWSSEAAGPSSSKGGQSGIEHMQRTISVSPGIFCDTSPGTYAVRKGDGDGPGQNVGVQATVTSSAVLPRVASAEGSGLTQGGAGLSSEGSGGASGSACSSPAPVVPLQPTSVIGHFTHFPIFFPSMPFPVPGATPAASPLPFAGVRPFPPWYEYPVCIPYFTGLPPSAVVPPPGTEK